MGTADPEKARCLARRLAVKWDEVEMTIETVAQRQNLTVDEQRAIYRAALEKVIGVAIGDLVAPKKYRGDEPGMERVMAGYYAALLQVDTYAGYNEQWFSLGKIEKQLADHFRTLAEQYPEKRTELRAQAEQIKALAAPHQKPMWQIPDQQGGVGG